MNRVFFEEPATFSGSNNGDRPAGLRDAYPSYASKRRALEIQLVDYFEQRGCSLVSASAIESLDTFWRAKTSLSVDDAYQILMAPGKLAVLRPEMTPSIARMAAPVLQQHPQPLYWCYAERVYRKPGSVSSWSELAVDAVESTQVGVEWMGVSEAADADLLLLCHEALQQLSVQGARTVVSHARLAVLFLNAAGISEDVIAKSLQQLVRGDYVGFQELMMTYHPSVSLLTCLRQLNPYDSESLERQLERCGQAVQKNTELYQVWNTVVSIAKQITELGRQQEYTFDFTLTRNIAYYTGILFETFAPGVGAPIALGGRYDELLKQYGADAPAVGFVLELERLLNVVASTTNRGGESLC